MRKFLLIILIVTSLGFRISRPPLFSHPLDQDQVNKLNGYLEDIWNLQNGEFNFDINSSTKTNAKNGDMWFIQTGNNIRIQYRANGHIFTITADGY